MHRKNWRIPKHRNVVVAIRTWWVEYRFLGNLRIEICGREIQRMKDEFSGKLFLEFLLCKKKKKRKNELNFLTNCNKLLRRGNTLWE